MFTLNNVANLNRSLWPPELLWNSIWSGWQLQKNHITERTAQVLFLDHLIKELVSGVPSELYYGDGCWHIDDLRGLPSLLDTLLAYFNGELDDHQVKQK